MSAMAAASWKQQSVEDYKQQVADKRDALMQSITDAVQSLAAETDEVRASEAMAKYFAFVSKFYHYSFRNQILIQLQKPNATLVAGFNAWQKKNRMVKKGEKGIAILMPRTYRPKDKDQEDAENGSATLDSDSKEDRKRIFFTVGYVFDVSQTEGEPLPQPQWRDKDKDLEIEDALKVFVARKGILVEYREDLGGAEGRCSEGKIELLPGAGTRTFVHELAHLLYEHCRPEIRKQTTRQQREIEADTTAYVVVTHFGLTASSANYLALWRAGKDDILACMQRVRGVAVEMIEAIEELISERYQRADGE